MGEVSRSRCEMFNVRRRRVAKQNEPRRNTRPQSTHLCLRGSGKGNVDIVCGTCGGRVGMVNYRNPLPPPFEPV